MEPDDFDNESPAERMKRIQRTMRAPDVGIESVAQSKSVPGVGMGYSGVLGGSRGPLSAMGAVASNPRTDGVGALVGRGALQAGPVEFSYQRVQPAMRGARGENTVGLGGRPFDPDTYFGVQASQGPGGRGYGVNVGRDGFSLSGQYNPARRDLTGSLEYRRQFAGGGPVMPSFDPMGGFTGMEGVEQEGRAPGAYEAMADRVAGAGASMGEPIRQAALGLSDIPGSLGRYLAETSQKPDPSQRIAEDIGKIGSAFVDEATKGPVEFAKTVGSFLPGIGEAISAYDATKLYDDLRKAEAEGDTKKADVQRQFYGAAVAGATPGVGLAARIASKAKRGAKGAEEVAEGAVRAADDAVAPVEAAAARAAEEAPEAVVKAEKALSGLSRVTPEEVEAARAANAGRGLEFPIAEGLDRVRLNLQRAKKATEKGTELPGSPVNERMVIRAPEGKPDFVIGKLDPEDWIARAEAMMTPDEIAEAARWYKTIRGEFLERADGDPKKADSYMRAWLVAQQNVDVAGAMNNVLTQREQILRGVPREEMRAAGMPNPTEAARSVLLEEPIQGGVGQKIADFVDAAEGKTVRSWMANHPDGGSPFVVDIHTARDTGLVDETLLNHLRRLGYNEEDIAKAKVDLNGTPSGTQYENRASWGRNDLTNYLNNIEWQGRKDWSPEEVQAVGWMGMTRLTADKAEDVVSGIERNVRRISFEIAPGEGSPWADMFGERFSALPLPDQQRITQVVAEPAMEVASKLSGIDLTNLVHGTGGWNMYQNPAAVGQALATKEGSEIAANALGYLLQQTEVWANNVKPMTKNPKSFAVDFVEETKGGNNYLATNEGLRDFWEQVQKNDPTGSSKNPLFVGYQPIMTSDGRPGIRVLIDRGGAKTQADLEEAINGPLTNMLRDMPMNVSVRGHEAEIVKARNDWKGAKDGRAYLERLEQLLGRNPSSELDPVRGQLEEIFKRELEGFKGKEGKAQGGQVGFAKGGSASKQDAIERAIMSFRDVAEEHGVYRPQLTNIILKATPNMPRERAALFAKNILSEDLLDLGERLVGNPKAIPLLKGLEAQIKKGKTDSLVGELRQALRARAINGE